MNHLVNAVGFNLKRNRKFIVDSVLRISQNSLMLCIEMLSVLRQLRSLRIDKVDKSENILARAVVNNIGEDLLALIALLYPRSCLNRKCVNQGISLLLCQYRLDSAHLSLVLKR